MMNLPLVILSLGWATLAMFAMDGRRVTVTCYLTCMALGWLYWLTLPFLALFIWLTGFPNDAGLAESWADYELGE